MTAYDPDSEEDFGNTQIDPNNAPVGAQGSQGVNQVQYGPANQFPLGRAEHLHQIAKHRSIARFGVAGWTQSIDENASLASCITETTWWKDDLTENEAIRMMSETLSEIVREREEKEEREAAEAAAKAKADAKAEEEDKEEHGCQSGTCGMCWRCDGEAHCEAWEAVQAASSSGTPETEADTTTEVQAACDCYSTPNSHCSRGL